MLKKHLTTVSAFALGAFLFGTAGFAFAHGGNTQLIHGCVRPLTGLLRIVGANDNCGPNETALDWNIQGVAGPQGPQGPAGSGGSGGVFAMRGSLGNGIRCMTLDGDRAGSCDGFTDFPMTQNGKLTNLAVHSVYNPYTVGVATVTVIVNNTPTTLEVEIPAGSTQVEIDNEEIAVQAGDLVRVEGTYPVENTDLPVNVMLEFVAE